MAPQSCLHLNPQKPWICYFTWWKGLWRCDWVKDLEWGDFLDYPGGSRVNTGPLLMKVGSGRVRVREGDVTVGAESEWCDMRKAQPAIAALKVEGATSQGIWAASRSWKRQGNPGECSPAAILLLAQWDPFWTFNLQNCKVNLFVLSHHICGNC